MQHAFIIGAQKSATSTLHEILSFNKNIDCGLKKEPDFFSRTESYEKGLSYYYRNYTQSNKSARLDSSQSYLSLEYVPNRINDTFGSHAKFILVLRNPADRIESAFNHFKSKPKGEISRSINEILPCDYVNMTRDDLLRYEVESVMDNMCKNIIIPRHDEWSRYCYPYNYIYNTCYEMHLKRYLAVFPKNKFLIVTFEDVIKNQVLVYQKICEFLKIEYDVNDISLGIHKNKAKYFNNDVVGSLVHSLSPVYGALKSNLPSFISCFIHNRIKPMVYSGEREVLDKSARQFIDGEFADEINNCKELLK